MAEVRGVSLQQMLVLVQMFLYQVYLFQLQQQQLLE
jgi:hypothetical protein